ncbi:MAG: hypothetical protein Q7U20_07230 [Caulobacter sp.]|nr:hypothetical protein [Caulobacter sp.]
MTFRSLETADLAGKRILQGAVLAMAGLVASSGVTFGCVVRNIIMWPEAYTYGLPGLGSAGDGPPTIAPTHIRLPGSALGDLVLPLVCLVALVVWGAAVVVFVRQRPQAPLTYLLVAMIASLFLWSSWGVWRFAYPVCNAM